MNPHERRASELRNQSILWARDVLARSSEYVIFDTETTGLKDSDVIVHFAVMSLDGEMLIDTKVRPTSKRRMSSEATYVHGLTMKDLKDAPLFEEVIEMLRPISETRKLLSFNASFHAGMIQQTCANEGTSNDHIRLDCYDVRDWYEKFTGLSKVALPGRKNTGVGDCRATLEVIRKMAAAEPTAAVPPPPRAKESDSVFWNPLVWALIVLVAFYLFYLSFRHRI